MDLVKILDFSFSYPATNKRALTGINMQIKGGDFLLICGQSGCGKTSLLRSLKREITPYGKREGSILYRGENIDLLDHFISASQIGFVMQDPDNQLVTDTVWHELAFGLENLGLPRQVIRRRIAETAHFFGISTWFEKPVAELSGGQKQLLNLAAIMTMQPQLLILDEPTAQLDPLVAKEFLSVIKRINQELGTTVILSEHRLEEILPLADKVAYMDRGELEFFGTPRDFCAHLGQDSSHVFGLALPSASKIARGLGEENFYPISVREGRQWLNNYINTRDFQKRELRHLDLNYSKIKPLLKARGLWFRYKKDEAFVLKGLDLDIYPGQLHAIVGGNGSGKTTALTSLAGVFAPFKGSIRVEEGELKSLGKNASYKNKPALLSQNPKTMFLCDRVYDDLLESLELTGNKDNDAELLEMARFLGIDHLLDSHPYDLSGGEQQKLALAKLLLLKPRVLLLDEPTKGLDVYAKKELAQILKERAEEGAAVVLATHDIEFVASYCDICSMLFNGTIVATGGAKAFFEGNSFYTTSANRISRGIVKGAVTSEDVVELCQIVD